ncbi:hypothetical protein Tco_1066426 [Tanacetum coccineum]|uniref:Uncharacterized protein n=1 Tax=Tanacetum coccineum TaxID=301880 RepID=A0ABQ5HAV4_9ASTR
MKDHFIWELFLDVIAGGTEGAVQQGPVGARVLNDLSAEEKERYKADIRATKYLLSIHTQSSKSPQSSNEPSLADNFQLDSGSSSTENLIETTVQDGKKVVVQDVRGRYNANNYGKTISEKQCKRNDCRWDVGGAPDLTHSLRSRISIIQIQERTYVIRNLKVLVANVNDRSCEPYNVKDVTALIEQNDCVRVELEKFKTTLKESV